MKTPNLSKLIDKKAINSSRHSGIGLTFTKGLQNYNVKESGIEINHVSTFYGVFYNILSLMEKISDSLIVEHITFSILRLELIARKVIFALPLPPDTCSKNNYQ